MMGLYTATTTSAMTKHSIWNGTFQKKASTWVEIQIALLSVANHAENRDTERGTELLILVTTKAGGNISTQSSEEIQLCKTL